MLVVILGAILVLGGVLFMAVQPIRRGRLSEKRSLPGGADGTLEPRRPGAGLSLKSNWLGLALIALGAVFLLAGMAV
jgi:hypothetical protein